VIIRKAYGAGLYAFGGPAFDPGRDHHVAAGDDSRSWGGGGGERRLLHKIQEKPEKERAAYVQQLRDEYKADIDIYKLAAEQVVDAIVPGERLRTEIAAVSRPRQRERPVSPKRRSVTPV